MSIEDKQEQPAKLLKLSASRSKTFEQCKRKYYFQYISHLPTLSWEHFDLGTYTHITLELFHRSVKEEPETPIKKLMSAASSAAYQRMILDNKTLTDELLRNAKAMLSDYLSHIARDGMPDVMEVEFPFTISLNDKYDLTGVIDRIDRDKDGMLHIMDYKTSKNAKYMEPFQLNTYGLYLLEKFPEVTRFRASYIMLKLGCQPLDYEFTVEDVHKCREKLINYADRITSEERWRAKPSKLCDWCDFKEVCLNSW